MIELHPDLKGGKLIKLQQAQIKMTDMFAHFDKLCRKYNLKYWCIGGTLIGIIRKDKINETGDSIGGWIPFDGDIDISMLDSDYEILKAHINELHPSMFLQDNQTDKHYKYNNLAKIRDLFSQYLNYYPKGCHRGLQIDIFIWTHKDDKLFTKMNWEKNERYDYYDVIFPVREAEFENLNVYIPNQYEKYAERKCGGYPPPYIEINKRYPHEGDVEPYMPHYDDVVQYSDLYVKYAMNTKDSYLGQSH